MTPFEKISYSNSRCRTIEKRFQYVREKKKMEPELIAYITLLVAAIVLPLIWWLGEYLYHRGYFSKRYAFEQG